MAKVQLGPNVTGMSGTIGNVVYSNWKGGTYVRTRAAVVANPQTAVQNKQRSGVSFGSKEFSRGTSPEQKALWEDYAAQKGAEVEAMRQSGGGQGIITAEGKNMSGYNAFLEVMLERESIGYSFREHVIRDAPKGIPRPDSPSGLAGVYDPATDQFDLEFYSPVNPGDPYRIGELPEPELEQPTMCRVWIKPPDAPARIAKVVPITSPGGKETVTIEDLTLLGVTIPLYKGQYRFQVDAISGFGRRSGASNLLAIMNPVFCIPPDMVQVGIPEYMPEEKVEVTIPKSLLDAACAADFVSIWIAKEPVIGWFKYSALRSTWQAVGVNYVILFNTGPLDPGNYGSRLLSETLAGGKSKYEYKTFTVEA